MSESPSTTSWIRSRIMSCSFLVARRRMRRALDPGADACIGPAATDVSGHRTVDIAIGRVGVGGEQGRCGHDLAGLAVAALRHLQLDPGLLNLLACRSGANGLDRRDALASHGRDGRDA